MAEKVVAEFCSECLESTLAQIFFTDSKECSECLSKVYFRAYISPEIGEEIQNLHDRLGLEYGPLILVYAAAGLVKLEYVDVEPEPMTESDVFERIMGGIKGEEGYAYDRSEFLSVIDAIGQYIYAVEKELIDEKRLQKLLKVTSRLKREILAEVL